MRREASCGNLMDYCILQYDLRTYLAFSALLSSASWAADINIHVDAEASENIAEDSAGSGNDDDILKAIVKTLPGR